MNISIIKLDTTVVIDGLGYSDLDVSSVASTIHAIQFDTETSTGHIEHTDGTNEVITSIADYQSIVDSHISQKSTNDATAATEAADDAALEATYSLRRKRAYDLLNQFEMRFDDLENSTTTWYDAIVAIKTEYPKP